MLNFDCCDIKITFTVIYFQLVVFFQQRYNEILSEKLMFWVVASFSLSAIDSLQCLLTAFRHTPKRKPMAKLVYNLMSERDIKKKLKELGLSTAGDKKVLNV